MNNTEEREDYTTPNGQEQQIKKDKGTKYIFIWLPLVIGISIAIGILVGNSFTKFDNSVSLFRRSGTKVDGVFEYIKQAYVDTVNMNDLIEAAIPTILLELDPHSSYISAEEMEDKGSELEGHFSGIGVEFMVQDDTVTIVNVTMGGPSEAMGIMAGDKIVTVNDSIFAGTGLSNTKVFKTLRGPKHTKVKIGIKRSTSDDILDFELTRADVPVKSVDASYLIDGNIGYIKISKFGTTTYNEFISAIAKLKSQGSKSFIIDLQQNTGGYLGAANMMTNEFLNAGDLILYTEGRAYPRENFIADGSGTCKEDEIVVLIDEGSASASEIFAGAIQDNDRGLIVGRRSFGKGMVQSQHQFSDMSAVRLTIARYHTPSGRCVQKPYERGKRDEYDLDILNRYNRGEFYSRDSIKMDNLPLFHTVGGRSVYGFDGIMADVFVPRDTVGVNSYYIKIVNSGLLREYAFSYTEKNRDKIKAMKDWQTAAKYLQGVPLVDNLVAYAENKKIRRRPVLIEESRSLMQTQLEALIIRNLFSDEGSFYEIYQRDDIIINKAVEMIKAGKASPKAVREEKYISTK